MSGDVISVDQSDLQDKLATYLGAGIHPSDVQLTLTSASVFVSARVIMPTIASANSAMTRINRETGSSLSTALSLPVTSVDRTSLEVVAFEAPSPPPPLLPPPSSSPSALLSPPPLPQQLLQPPVAAPRNPVFVQYPLLPPNAPISGGTSGQVDRDGGGSVVGPIVGGIVGGLALLVICFVAFWCRRKRKAQSSHLLNIDAASDTSSLSLDRGYSASVDRALSPDSRAVSIDQIIPYMRNSHSHLGTPQKVQYATAAVDSLSEAGAPSDELTVPYHRNYPRTTEDLDAEDVPTVPYLCNAPLKQSSTRSIPSGTTGSQDAVPLSSCASASRETSSAMTSVVIIRRGTDGRFHVGFSSSEPGAPVLVSAVLPSDVPDDRNTMKEGDHLVAINGTTVEGLVLYEVNDLVAASGEFLELKIERMGGVPALSHISEENLLRSRASSSLMRV